MRLTLKNIVLSGKKVLTFNSVTRGNDVKK